ncbi:DUF2164 domain-containing protein [Pradoshia sp.]
MLVKWNAEERKHIISEIQYFYHQERGEEIGELAAGTILDFFAEQIGPYYYNAGVKDAVKQAEAHSSRLEEDLYALLRQGNKR